MTGHIVDTFALIQFRRNEVSVAVVVKKELYLGEITLTVAEFLGKIKAEAVHMAVVYERIVEAAVGTLP